MGKGITGEESPKTGAEASSGTPSVEELLAQVKALTDKTTGLEEESQGLKSRLGEVNAESKERKEKLRELEVIEKERSDKAEADKAAAKKGKEDAELAEMGAIERLAAMQDKRDAETRAFMEEQKKQVEGLVSKLTETERVRAEHAKTAAITEAIGKYKTHNPNIIKQALADKEIPLKDGEPDQEVADKLVKEFVEANKYILVEKTDIPDWGGSNPPAPGAPGLSSRDDPKALNEALMKQNESGDKEGALFNAIMDSVKGSKAATALTTLVRGK